MYRKLFLFFIFLGSVFVTPATAQFTEKILAVVNDEAITQSDVDEILAPIYFQYRNNYKGQELQQKMETARKDILDQLISDKLLLQEARGNELRVEEREVERIIDDLKKNFPTEEEFNNILNAQEVTLEELRKRYREQLLIKKIVEKNILSKVFVSPTQVAEYYQANQEKFRVPEQVQLRSIFLENKNNEETEKKAEEIYGQLKQGTPFIELVEKYSEAPNVVNAGDMGFVGRGTLREEIEAKVFDLAAGQFTEPIKTPAGCYIYKVESRKEAFIPPLEDVRDQIEKVLFQETAKLKLDEWVNKLKESAHIEVKKDEEKS